MVYPTLTEFEEKVFRIFWKKWRQGYHFDTQLEGDGRVAIVSAGRRMVKKGVLTNWASCRWGLTKIGEDMALKRQQEDPAFKIKI